MTDVRVLVAKASAYGLLLSPEGSRLRVDSVTGEPVPATFRTELLAQKADLLAYFAWRDEAIEIVCAAMRRLADHYVVSCPSGSPELCQVDAAITDAFWKGDLPGLRETVGRYEDIATQRFQLLAAELKSQRGP